MTETAYLVHDSGIGVDLTPVLVVRRNRVTTTVRTADWRARRVAPGDLAPSDLDLAWAEAWIGRSPSARSDALDDYAGVADEVIADGPGTGLGLDDLDAVYVATARASAIVERLPWPPDPAWEDDVRDARWRLARLASPLDPTDSPT